MSPMPVEKLTKQSSKSTIREAVNASYEMCMKERANAGESVAQHQKRCGGMIHGIAREKTGKQMKKMMG